MTCWRNSAIKMTPLSGLIYKALGIPNNMFTVMFAIARTVGWVSQ